MSFSIIITGDICHTWKVYDDWDCMCSFTSFMINQYPDLIINISILDMANKRLFTFKSEAHYTWFLLQQ